MEAAAQQPVTSVAMLYDGMIRMKDLFIRMQGLHI